MSSKQEAIYDAALMLFAERGYDGTTVPMIAKEASVGAGTIYRYFENKESLLNALFEQCVRQLSDAIRQDFPNEASIREQFNHIFSRIFDFARCHVQAFLFIQSHDDGHYLDQENKAMFHDFLDFIIKRIESGQEQGVLRSLPSAALIALVYGPIEMMIKMMESGKLSYSPELVSELEKSTWDAIRLIK